MMEENFLFLLQTAKTIKSGNYDDDDVEFLNELALTIDNFILIDYNNTVTIKSLGNDLDFFIGVIRFLIKYYEREENYENCFLLKQKLDESINIKENKITNHEHIKNV
jgi:hypothetical protein